MLKLAAVATLHRGLPETPPPPNDVRAELAALSGRSFRRINRFIELSLLGAIRCRQQLPAMAQHAALYLCTDTGMLADTTRIVGAMLSEHRVPTPFEFMNVSGPMAAFSVAQALNLEGPQLTVHRSHATFESALQLLTLRSAPHRQALVGFVEEGCWPLAEQRERLHWPRGVLAECSHWFYFDADASAPLAQVDWCRRFLDWESLRAGLADLDRSDLVLGASEVSRNTADLDGWARELSIRAVHRPLEAPTYSGGLVALSLGGFVLESAAPRLLHINRASDGSYYATLASRPRDPTSKA